MTRKIFASVAALVFVAALVGAEDMDDFAGPEMEELVDTVSEFTLANADEEAGSITIGEYRTLLARLSVLQQQAAYVRKTAAVSFFMPGTGHISNGAAGAGALFIAGELLISGGTLVGAYFLLPESVQFNQLNYFTDSFGAIETAWKDLNFVDVLPSMGVMAAGALIDVLYSGFVAKNAAELARARIDSGEEEFKPEVGMFMGAEGLPMMGMRHRF